MQINMILAKIGVVLVRAERESAKLLLLLRSGKTQREVAQWKLVIEEYLQAANTKKAQKENWAIDISQYFYLTDAGSVRYLWRVIITGNLKDGTEQLGKAVLRVVSQGVEVTEMPLIGRSERRMDYAAGKTKGAHEVGVAEALVAQHFLVGR